MTKATSLITDRFKDTYVSLDGSPTTEAEKAYFAMGFRWLFESTGKREVKGYSQARYIRVDSDGNISWASGIGNGPPSADVVTVAPRKVTLDELKAAAEEVRAIKREESKASKKRRAQRKWDATATKRTTETCPVRKDVVVAVKLVDGEVITERAGWFDWTTDPCDRDIASYKVLTPNKHKPKPVEGKAINVEQLVSGIAESLGREVAAVEPAAPDTNPKKQFGLASIPLEMWPDLASAYGALALYNGAMKYGKANFANTPVDASIYIAGARRHLASWCAGEEFDQADGVPHLGAVLANIAILICARAAGTLIDDRMLLDGYLKERDALKALVLPVAELHADKNPHHYTRNNV